ncbi:methionyl-tRNA formyltransferase [Candidatus Uhrbacteria bacterium]|nr:methionyl-tRNA formyltransferase [Candidatus Uhrbacteria bacterium]
MTGVLYFGTSEFAVAALEALAASPSFRVIGVVTQPDKPVGRKGEIRRTPAAEAALRLGLPLHQFATLKDPSTAEAIRSMAPDLFIVAAYGKIIPASVLEIPRLGALNLHGSLLPKYRGASPIQAVILAGERQTGVTLMRMDSQVDHGPVLAAAKTPIADDDTHASLEKKLGAVAAELLIETLPAYVRGELTPKEQRHDDATFTKVLGREDGLVRWTVEDAAAIERKLRAYDPWPGAYAVWLHAEKHLRLKLLKVSAIKKAPADAPVGTVFRLDDGFPAVKAARGAIKLEQIQLEGKKPASGKSFLDGYAGLVGARLEEPSEEKAP